MTRDETGDGPLSTALRGLGFDPVACVVMEEQPPSDLAALQAAADSLDRFDWIVCSSARAVRALVSARSAPWPPGVRTAAVGARTARALIGAGADPPPVVGRGDGADELWAELSRLTWSGRRVLVPTVPGGRRLLSDALRAAGAVVDDVDAYRMAPRSPETILATWAATDPDAAVIGSPSAATALAAAVGARALSRKVIVAIGSTTSAALSAAGVRHHVSPRADFAEAARRLAALRKD